MKNTHGLWKKISYQRKDDNIDSLSPNLIKMATSYDEEDEKAAEDSFQQFLDHSDCYQNTFSFYQENQMRSTSEFGKVQIEMAESLNFCGNERYENNEKQFSFGEEASFDKKWQREMKLNELIKGLRKNIVIAMRQFSSLRNKIKGELQELRNIQKFALASISGFLTQQKDNSESQFEANQILQSKIQKLLEEISDKDVQISDLKKKQAKTREEMNQQKISNLKIRDKYCLLQKRVLQIEEELKNKNERSLWVEQESFTTPNLTKSFSKLKDLQQSLENFKKQSFLQISNNYESQKFLNIPKMPTNQLSILKSIRSNEESCSKSSKKINDLYLSSSHSKIGMENNPKKTKLNSSIENYSSNSSFSSHLISVPTLLKPSKIRKNSITLSESERFENSNIGLKERINRLKGNLKKPHQNQC